jgi:hypothetical protein
MRVWALRQESAPALDQPAKKPSQTHLRAQRPKKDLCRLSNPPPARSPPHVGAAENAPSRQGAFSASGSPGGNRSLKSSLFENAV